MPKYEAMVVMVAGRGDKDVHLNLSFEATTDAEAVAKVAAVTICGAKTAKDFQDCLADDFLAEKLTLESDVKKWIKFVEYNAEEYDVLSLVNLDSQTMLMKSRNVVRIAKTLEF